MKRITTASGSVYALDEEAMTVRRVPSVESNRLRKDAQALPLLGVPLVELGESMHMLIDVRGDDISTVRTTTPVVAIEEI